MDKGEFLFLIGPTGSGKTTLFRLLIRDLMPSTGSIIINDSNIVTLPYSKVPSLRRKIGVVFQDLKLLMDRTVFENVILPLEMSGLSDVLAKQKVDEVLAAVGIAQHHDKFPIQLSGGELQRVAIARALVFSPEILLADEPTGNLDAATSWEIVKLLQDINKTGATIIMATHNTDVISNLPKRAVVLEKGKVVSERKAAAEKKPAKLTQVNKQEAVKNKKE
ncbi:MAG: ATP-binding cassette domain-containing protein [Candidatus Levybacteria bacterium]|nr:ATP-binding cassette domain-containing protein [Candidatus Levybacteria bacterium]